MPARAFRLSLVLAVMVLGACGDGGREYPVQELLGSTMGTTFSVKIGNHAGNPRQHAGNGALDGRKTERKRRCSTVKDTEQSTDADVFAVARHENVNMLLKSLELLLKR